MVLDTTLLNTQHYKVRIKGKVEQFRERRSALPYTLVSKLSKREPFGSLLTTVANFTFYWGLYKIWNYFNYFSLLWVRQKFCNILLTYLLYSSMYNKSSPEFKVKVIMLHRLKSPFHYYFDPILIPVLVLWGKEFLHWSFHHLLVIGVLWV